MFHIGHLTLINNAAKQCDKLIVGVNSDVLVQTYKNKKPVVNEYNRVEIIRNIKSFFLFLREMESFFNSCFSLATCHLPLPTSHMLLYA